MSASRVRRSAGPSPAGWPWPGSSRLPAAGIVGALSYWLSYGLKSATGSQLVGDGVIFLILVGLSGYMYWRAQQQKVDHSNVNADWDESTNSVVPAEVRESKVAKSTASV